MNIDTYVSFFKSVKRSFKFLVDDLNYRLTETVIEDLDEYRDTKAAVLYLGRKVAVEVYWAPTSGAYIGVALIEVKQKDVYPYKGRFFGHSRGDSRAINLASLLEMRGNADLIMLQPIRSVTPAAVRKRQALIEKNMEGIIANLANVLREQAPDILKGDTSMFSKVQKHEEELFLKEYPHHKWQFSR
jgi:hypothetical protein